MLKNFGVLSLTLLLAACGAPKTRPSPPSPAPAAGASAPSPTDVGVFRIDPDQSGLRILVHRAGAMARLGHNHVIDNDGLNGWVRFSGDIATASFNLAVPVNGFVVDATQARNEEGPDFAESVPDDAKDGTRHNMLSAALLDGEQYPIVTLSSLSLTLSPGAPATGALPPGALPTVAPVLAAVTLSIAGHQSTISVPLNVETSSTRISAFGGITLRQTAIGLTPFSVMLGALQVQDEITVKFHLIAMANEANVTRPRP